MGLKGQKLEIQLPDPVPDLGVHPDIAAMRERLARVETSLETRGTDPVAAEALRLAGEAHSLAAGAVERLAALPATVEKATDPAVVVPLEPEISAPLVDPAVDPLPQIADTLEHPRPWWHPSRIL